MNFKKLIAILLCFCLVLVLLVVCTRTSNEGFAAFPPDTIMINAGDLTISWAEFYVFLFGAVAEFSQNFTLPIEWDEELFDDKTVADMILDVATDEALQMLVFEYAAKANNVAISDEDMALFENELSLILEMYDSQEEMEQEMFELYGIYSMEVYSRLMMVLYLNDLLRQELYGDYGELLSDDDASAFAEEHGFMRVKHILRLKPEDGDDDFDGDPLAEAEAILRELHDFINNPPDDFNGTLEDFFAELVFEHSEDPGSFASPDGYLFQFGDMVEPFSVASEKLKIGEISDIVETAYGYHIILRLPIDFDMVPMVYVSMGYSFPLRMIASYELFNAYLESVKESFEHEFTSEYKSIILSDIFT
ncbi:MAG: peptidyl-prolyl cis-trans isomerase [Oscillospiraceae bacterium]|jgi:hypothetical protein|nr:peptidyl-prolyl cis-trans isomerase [Oscillospiraceae bacterium]